MRRCSTACAIAVLVTLVAPAPAQALPRRAEVQTYRSGLDFPVDLAWVRGTNKLFFTEKDTGRVRVLVGRRLLARPCVDLDVLPTGTEGALGLALHPRFERNKWLYVYYTNRSPHQQRVTRFKVQRNRCTRPRHIVQGLRAGGSKHNGGQLEFVGGKLFVSTGDASEPSLSPDTNSRQGKILRVNPNGSIPPNNPFGRRNSVWAYGLRNPFGMAVKPGTRRVYVTDNGPDCDDELNRILKGRNYGWGPDYQCGTNGVGPNPTPPMIRWDTIVPTDPVWYEGRFKAMSGSLYVPDFGGRLRRVVTNDRGNRVRRERVVHNHSDPIVSASIGPGRWLYFNTPDAIYRIVRR